MATKLSENDIRAKLESVPGWSFDNGKLHREFKFRDFQEAFAFMTRCALVAEKADHHPEWFNVYNKVRVDLATHDAGGVTEKDFDLAAKMNKFSA